MYQYVWVGRWVGRGGGGMGGMTKSHTVVTACAVNVSGATHVRTERTSS